MMLTPEEIVTKARRDQNVEVLVESLKEVGARALMTIVWSLFIALPVMLLINGVCGMQFRHAFFDGQIGYWQSFGLVILVALPEILRRLPGHLGHRD